MTRLILVGLTHRSAPVELREQVALPQEERPHFAKRLRRDTSIVELLILSTCNRTEIYVVIDGDGAEVANVEQGIVDALLERASTTANGAASSSHRSLRELFVIEGGDDAVRHAFEVAAGLDSLVLGETQILAQVRGAFEEAQEQREIGPIFRRLFPSIFQAAKKVHTETLISSGAASIGSIAVELAGKIFSDFDRRTALLIGAGATGETIARAMADRRIARLLIAGRGLERSTRLATELGAAAIPIDEAMTRIAEIDILLTAAHATDGRYVITQDQLKQALPRRNRELLVIDVGVPRNVDPMVSDLADVFLYDLDDLQVVADETRRRRERELPKARQWTDRGVASFLAWWKTSEGVGPLLRDLHQHFGRVAGDELRKSLAKLPPEHHPTVEVLTRSIVSKLLQRPTLLLKENPDDVEELERIVRRLFALQPTDAKERP